MKTCYFISGHKSATPNGIVATMLYPDAGQMLKDLREQMRGQIGFLAHQIIQQEVDLEITDNKFYYVSRETTRPFIIDLVKLIFGEDWKQKGIRILEVQEVTE